MHFHMPIHQTVITNEAFKHKKFQFQTKSDENYIILFKTNKSVSEKALTKLNLQLHIITNTIHA